MKITKKVQLEGKVKHMRFLWKHCLQFFSPLASFILFFWKMLSLLSSDLCSDLLNRANSSGGSEDGQIIVKCCLHTSNCDRNEHWKWQMKIAVCRTRLGCRKHCISFDSRQWRKLWLVNCWSVFNLFLSYRCRSSPSVGCQKSKRNLGTFLSAMPHRPALVLRSRFRL